MARREWADKIVKQEMTGYHWNARIKKSTVILPDIAAKLLVKEHARAVRVVKRAKRLELHGLRDTDTNEFLEGYEAACVDILAALSKGRA